MFPSGYLPAFPFLPGATTPGSDAVFLAGQTLGVPQDSDCLPWRERDSARELWIQKNCSSTSDCREPMAACFSGQCLCDKGFFYDHTENACVSSEYNGSFVCSEYNVPFVCSEYNVPCVCNEYNVPFVSTCARGMGPGVEMFGCDLGRNDSIVSPAPCQTLCGARPDSIVRPSVGPAPRPVRPSVGPGPRAPASPTTLQYADATTKTSPPGTYHANGNRRRTSFITR
ncbi:hypothetical protein ACOMHN_058031 [Nucella lapillus]